MPTSHPERFVCCPPMRASGAVAGLRARAVAGQDEHGFHDPGPVGRALNADPLAGHPLG